MCVSSKWHVRTYVHIEICQICNVEICKRKSFQILYKGTKAIYLLDHRDLFEHPLHYRLSSLKGEF